MLVRFANRRQKEAISNWIFMINENYEDILHYDALEVKILCCVDSDNSTLTDIKKYLRPEMFTDPQKREMYNLMLEINSSGRTVDILAMTQLAREKGSNLTSVDMLITQGYGSSLDAVTYAKALAESWIKRRAKSEAQRIVLLADKPDTDAFDLLEDWQRAGEIVADGTDLSQTTVDFKFATEDAINYMEAASEGMASGVPSGLTEIDDMTSGWQRGDFIVIAGRPAMGKALGINELCMTKDGKTRMGDVKVGDEILNANGSTSKVLGVWFQGKRQMYNVTFNDGQTISADGEHYWKVQTRSNRKSSNPEKQTSKLTTLELINLGVRTGSDNRLNFSVDHCSPVAHSKKETPIDPWLLGMWLGDGWGTDRTTPYIANEEADIRDKIVEATIEGGCYYGNDKEISFRISSKMREDLDKLGLLGKLSDTKFIPEDYLYNSIENRTQLLRGLIDSDGHVVSQSKGGTQNQIEYSTTSTRLRDDIITLVRGLGGRASFTSREGRYKLNGVYHKVKDNYRVWIAFSGEDAIVPVSSKKHLAKYSKSSRVIPRFIESIEVADIEEAVCLTTSAEDSLFLTTDYCVTHNSALVTTFVNNAANQGYACALFSLEMNTFQVTCRLVADQLQIPLGDLTKRVLNEHQRQLFNEGLRSMSELPITIDDSGSLSVDQLKSKARELHRKGLLDLLVVDYLQLMSDNTAGSREQEIGSITRCLKSIAKELNIPVIALSQISRAVESRDNPRPKLSDLRESGSIEQDADMVMFLYRPEYYFDQDGDECPPDLVGICQLIIGKYRNGEGKDIKLAFKGQYSVFKDREDLHITKF